MKSQFNSISRFIILCVLLGSILACSKSSDNFSSAKPVEIRNGSDESNDKKDKMLAYEHKVTIKHIEEEILPHYNSTIQLCQSNADINCSVLSASFSHGSYERSTIIMRVDSSGVNTLINHAKDQGEITQQATTIDDLTKSFIETEKRKEMLTQYRDKLLEIQIKAANDVESLVKIAKELTTTQNQIEQLQNSKSRLEKRVERDLLTITFMHATKDKSMWDSIIGSITDIPENFAYGFSDTLEEIVYLIPWFFVMVFMFIFFRWLWHKTAAKSKK
ncbi:MAG: DUF4349 domain-containing protein [Marinicellaceae bacterium]